MEKGRMTSTGKANTIAEGLATVQTYELPFTFLKDKIDDMVLVSDKEIIEAVRNLFETEYIVAEPSGVASLAAALKKKNTLKGLKVIVTITGGNISQTLLSEICHVKSLNK